MPELMHATVCYLVSHNVWLSPGCCTDGDGLDLLGYVEMQRNFR